MAETTAILIPARLSSTRFPKKPLIDINGRSMIVRVCQQARKTGIENIIVACSEDEVKKEVEKFGFTAIMTDPNLPSGTDRIYSALLKSKLDFDIIVNLQGDLPNIDPDIINKTIKVLKKDKSTDIATSVVKISDKKDIKNPNIVKALVDFSKNQEFAKVYYFSRSVIPYNAIKKNISYYEHIGIYVYRKSVLQKFIELPESYFEKIEKLEQLRAIENNLIITACHIDKKQKPISIDTKEDLEKLLKATIT